jgi:glycerate 2-kinase
LYFIVVITSLIIKLFMRILIAPNAFKNALRSVDAAGFILEGLKMSGLKFTSTIFPVADGGDDTGSLLIKKCGGKLIGAIVKDPIGRKIETSFGISADGHTAIIELAAASGLRLLTQKELDPLHASTGGTGELIRMALDQRVKRILLCVGGSATIDGGSGILRELGVQFLDKDNSEMVRTPESLLDLDRIDISKLDKRIGETEIIVLCDVSNPLLGDQGAASIFGPQKGAGKKDILKLERALKRLNDITFSQTGRDMAALRFGGAAGGVAAGLAVFLGAELVAGSDFFLDFTDFNKSLQNTDLVITGEGSIDSQTLQGKAPFGVAKRAKHLGIPVIGLAGKIEFDKDDQLLNYFNILLPLADTPADLSTALKQTGTNLISTAKTLGDFLALRLDIINPLF